jgi:rieske iron-sulfur protein
VDRKPGACGCRGPIERRAALKLALGALLGLDGARFAVAQNVDPRGMRPQPGDRLVFADGERQGNVVSAADLQSAGSQVLAFPSDAASRVVRDGSRLNKILLIRCDPATLNDETRRRAVEGITAYSAICTHQGCDVTAWDAQIQALWCPCHDSKYDPRESGRVVHGPAPKRLAALPLKLVDGQLVVAAGFSGAVGFQTR